MDKTPTLSDLEYFISVVSEGSLTGASKRLRVQQSTLTMAIQRLETITGASLLVRARTGVQPTQAGRIFLEKSKVLLEQWYDVSNELSGKKKTMRTRLSLGCHQTTGLYALRKFLPHFLNSNPEIEITVQHDYASNIIENVLSYRLDFGLAVNPVQHQEMEIVPLYKTYLALWGSDLSTKLNKGVLFYDPQMYGIELIMAQLNKRGPKFDRYLTVSSLDTIASLVISGAGYALLPADTACSLGQSSLKLIWEPKIPELIVSLLFRKDVQHSRAANLFTQAAKTELGKLLPGKKYKDQV